MEVKESLDSLVEQLYQAETPIFIHARGLLLLA